MQGFARDSPDGVTRDCTTDFTRDFVGEQETEVEDSQQVFTKPKLWWSSASVFLFIFSKDSSNIFWLRDSYKGTQRETCSVNKDENILSP